MRTETLIIGGGLSGLSLASGLAARRRPFLLLEARHRLGGRILTEPHGDGFFDLGPTWFWAGQPRIEALTQQMNVVPFEQFGQGDQCAEDERGVVQRMRGLASMQGSYRLEGGLGALINRLAAELPADGIRLSTRVTGLEMRSGEVAATTADGSELSAERVVLALPPRIAAQLSFSPALPTGVVRIMNDTVTWMAGQAKAVAVYDRPFWREAGLSGDAFSRRGPMVEIHDASPAIGGPAALFGFIGLTLEARSDEQRLRTHLQDQLARLFGPDAADPMALLVKDWAFDPFTATPADRRPQYTHPQYGLPNSMRGLWQDRLLFAGTEVAPRFGGYLEGALEAADAVLAQMENAEV